MPLEIVKKRNKKPHGIWNDFWLDFGAPGLDFGGSGTRFWLVWDAPKRVLEGPGPIFGLFFGKLMSPHVETPADNCGNALLPSLVSLPTFSNTM